MLQVLPHTATAAPGFPILFEVCVFYTKMVTFPYQSSIQYCYFNV